MNVVINNLKEKISSLKKEFENGILQDDEKSSQDTSLIKEEDIRFGGLCESDVDSIDDVYDDPFRHCDVFQADEAVVILRDKMIKLQSLYIGQLKRLQHLYVHGKKTYLRDKSLNCNNTEMITNSRHLNALSKYHRRNGLETVMQQRNRLKRMQSGSFRTIHPNEICNYSDDSHKCDKIVLPLTKYCLSHILCDEEQKLYKSCNYGGLCCQPILAFDSFCNIHKLEWSTLQSQI